MGHAALFAVTLTLLMQESIKLILHSAVLYVKDVTNLRRSAAYIMYLASGMIAFYRATSIYRAQKDNNPIPMLMNISDSRIAGLYAEVCCICILCVTLIERE
jgi:hypothetical protein